MNTFNNLKTAIKLLGGFAVIVILLVIIAVIGYINMQSINAGMFSMYHESLTPIEELSGVQTDIFEIRGNLYKYIILPNERTTIQDSINTISGGIDTVITQYKSTSLDSEEQKELPVLETAWAKYKQEINKTISLVQQGDQEGALKNLGNGGSTSNARQAVGASLDKLITINVDSSKALSIQGDTSFSQASLIILIASILAVIFSVTIGLIINSSITTPLNLLVKIAGSLSQGDLVRDLDEKTKDSVLKRQDEIGNIGKAFNQLINYMQEMGQLSLNIAKNDLTMRVNPKSPKDELGNAFFQMVAGLNSTIRQVAENATNLSTASGDLASAANQAGQATSQISATIQQIASGTAQQAESVSRTASSVEQMSRAIDGVAKGAQEQASAVGKASEITGQISKAIEQVTINVQTVTRESAGAANAANEGAKTVGNTVQGMEKIRTKVGLSTQKVQEMGKRSEQISLIVETIEDIASQTNLLALNAAIEAARAGEHGKGFSVVADEVRKLAEKSSGATKEIGGLIKEIQRTVSEAVIAMEESTKEVAEGVTKANEAGTALSTILKSTEAVRQQAEQATHAAEKMNTFASELVNVVDTVSAIVEENTAATEEMSAGSNEVTQSIENIASISEENSASVEEVSASTEEMSAQVEEVGASAQSLTEMAHTLQQIVSRFHLAQDRT